MITALLIALLLGILIGILTGLTPGIHINLVAALVLASLAFFLNISSPLAIVIFIVALSITHIFIDFIPSIYLGAPDENNALSVMPGHKLLLEGNGHEAIYYSILGCLSAVFISILLAPIILLLVPKIYPFIELMMAWILILGAGLLIYYEQNSKLWAIIIFILSGFLGIASLNINLNEPLLPLLSGLFGSSTLIYSISQKTKIPQQKLTKIKLNKKEFIKPLIATSLISPICAFLPGLGSSQAAVLSSQFTGKNSPNQFLFLVGSVSIIVMTLSFPVLYILNKSRTGSAAAINEVIKLTKSDLIYILAAVLISSIISFCLAIKISKIFAKSLPKLNYTLISIIILTILSLLVLIISKPLGFLVYLVSTLLGLLAIETQIRRSSLMGCLLIPTILYYLPF